MSRHQVITQLFVDGRPIWRVTQPLAPELASRMTEAELTSIGEEVENRIAELIAARKTAEKKDPILPPAASVTGKSKPKKKAR
jgi:hypothetical protein